MVCCMFAYDCQWILGPMSLKSYGIDYYYDCQCVLSLKMLLLQPAAGCSMACYAVEGRCMLDVSGGLEWVPFILLQ